MPCKTHGDSREMIVLVQVMPEDFANDGYIERLTFCEECLHASDYWCPEHGQKDLLMFEEDKVDDGRWHISSACPHCISNTVRTMGKEEVISRARLIEQIVDKETLDALRRSEFPDQISATGEKLVVLTYLWYAELEGLTYEEAVTMTVLNNCGGHC